MTAPGRPPTYPLVPPVRYVGLEAIAARCGVSRNTVRDRFTRGELLMYRQRVGPRWAWITNEALLFASEMARCRRDWQAQQARRQARQTDRR